MDQENVKRRFKIVETCQYEIPAGTSEEAEAIWLDKAPEFGGPVSFEGVIDRIISEVPAELFASGDPVDGLEVIR